MSYKLLTFFHSLPFTLTATLSWSVIPLITGLKLCNAVPSDVKVWVSISPCINGTLTNEPPPTDNLIESDGKFIKYTHPVSLIVNLVKFLIFK